MNTPDKTCEHPARMVERVVLESFRDRADLCRCWACGAVWWENQAGPTLLTSGNYAFGCTPFSGVRAHVPPGWHLMNQDGGGI